MSSLAWVNLEIRPASPLAVITVGHTWMRDMEDMRAPVYADPRDILLAGEVSLERPLDVRCRECDTHTLIRYADERMTVYVMVGHADDCPWFRRRIHGINETVARQAVSVRRKQDGLGA